MTTPDEERLVPPPGTAGRPQGEPAWPDALDDEAAKALELEKRLEYLARRPEVQVARDEVLAARANLVDERVRLEASARAAMDIPGRIRRAPAKTAGAAAGAAFLLFGGPARVVRGVRRAILGPRADLPKSMLPDEVEKELRKLGDDGQRVRARLEREFARYLEDKADVRRERDFLGTITALAGAVLKPASVQAGKRLAEQLFDPDAPGYSDALRRARERAERTRRRDEPPPG